jgi:hypothetical protein
MTPPYNPQTHRERDKPDVVVEGKTTFISSVSIALIVSKLRWESLWCGVKSISGGQGMHEMTCPKL